MKLNIEELAVQAGFMSRSAFNYGEELEAFARLIVERCAMTAQHANDWRGGHGEPGTLSGEELAALIRKLLETE